MGPLAACGTLVDSSSSIESDIGSISLDGSFHPRPFAFNGFPALFLHTLSGSSLSEGGLYAVVAGVVYMACMAVAVFFGVYCVAKVPSDLAVFVRAKHRPLWAAILLLSALTVACLVGIVVRDGRATDQFYGVLAISMVVTLTAAAIAFPAAAATDAPTPLPAKSFYSAMCFLIPLALVWSAGSMIVMGAFLELKVNDGGLAAHVDMSDPLSFLLISCFGMIAAILEEILFRGSLIGFFQRIGLPPVVAVFLAAAGFAMGHANYVTPNGVKEIQILGLGLILGFTRCRYGLSAAIVIHFVHNFAALAVSALFPDLNF